MGKTLSELFEEVHRMFDALSEEEKAEVEAQVERMGHIVKTNRLAGNLRWSGCLDYDEWSGVSFGAGEHYVYLWKHVNGSPFYVGSGKGDRWLAHRRGVRSEEFIREAEKMDSVVYKIARGLDERTARIVEFCCVHKLTYDGIDLAQKTWNYNALSENAKRIQRERYLDRKKKPEVARSELELEKILCKKETYDLDEIYRKYDSEYGWRDDAIPIPQKRAATLPPSKTDSVTTRPPATEATEDIYIISSKTKKIKEEK